MKKLLFLHKARAFEEILHTFRRRVFLFAKLGWQLSYVNFHIKMGIQRRTFVPSLKAGPFYIKITRTNPTRFAWRELCERVAPKRARFLFRKVSLRSQRALDASAMAKFADGIFGGKYASGCRTEKFSGSEKRRRFNGSRAQQLAHVTGCCRVCSLLCYCFMCYGLIVFNCSCK